MDKIKQAIIESIDTALSKFSFINKEQFFSILQQDSGVTKEQIPDKYDVFHKLLIDIYGTRHFEVEREIIRVLHKRSLSGEYKEVNEVPAFALMVESYFKETNQAVQAARKGMQEAKAQIEYAERKQAQYEKAAEKNKHQQS